MKREPHKSRLEIFALLILRQTKGHTLLWRSEDASNEAGYTAAPVACGWVGAVFEVTSSFGQEKCGQKPQKAKKSKV